jgi:hypothetical protein
LTCQLIDSFKTEILSHEAAQGASEVEVLAYSTQVVAGLNFRVKVQAGPHQLNVVVWRKPGGETQLTSVSLIE